MVAPRDRHQDLESLKPVGTFNLPWERNPLVISAACRWVEVGILFSYLSQLRCVTRVSPRIRLLRVLTGSEDHEDLELHSSIKIELILVYFVISGGTLAATRYPPGDLLFFRPPRVHV